MRFEPAERLAGRLAPPPDKSISHRAALIGAMCEGTVEVHNYLRSEDTAATLAAVHQLGAEVLDHNPGRDASDLVLRGTGLRGAARTPAIDVGNAGTLLRLLPGWLAGQGSGSWTLDGDASIRRRPVDRVAEPLRLMGARVECRDGRLPPLEVRGSDLRGIRYELPVASAQVKSCVLLAGLLAAGDTIVVEPLASRDHTELMLAAAGASIERQDGRLTVRGTDRLALSGVRVPGDFSSAAFMIVAGTLVHDSEVVLEGVGVNPTRTGLLAVLDRMGGSCETIPRAAPGPEATADLIARHAPLSATTVTAAEVPLLIDELPLVALLGAMADGETVVEGAQELRHKESDRIATVVDGLGGLGVDIEARPDGFAVRGTGRVPGGRIDAAGDHRLAMLGAVAGLVSDEGVEVSGFHAAAVSYPRFAEDLADLL